VRRKPQGAYCGEDANGIEVEMSDLAWLAPGILAVVMLTLILLRRKKR
jgi:hypothetical protein